MPVAERSTITDEGHESDDTENLTLLRQLDLCYAARLDTVCFSQSGFPTS